MKVRLLRGKDHDLLFSRACEVFFNMLRSLPSETIVLALPGGRSVVPFLEKIVEKSDELAQEIWDRLEIFMLDERVVPLDDAASNFGGLSEHLSSLVASGRLVVEQLHPFIANFELKDYGAKAYAAELQEFGGKFNLAVLGVGEDAHVGAIFPGHPSILDDNPYFITMDDSPKPPSKRMSSSRSLIACSDKAIAFFIGEAKRSALQRFFDSEARLKQCPAKLLNVIKESYIVTDIDGPLIG